MDFKTYVFSQSTLPLVIEPVDKKMNFSEFMDALKNSNAFMHHNLLKYGGILLRNFPIQSAEDFKKTIENIHTGNCIDYIGGDSPRKKVLGNIYTSTEAPPSVKIPLHNELSYIKKYPPHIYFFCETAAEGGGATILADARKVYADMDQGLRKQFIDQQILYESSYFYKSGLMDFINAIQKGHKSWIDVFETEDKKEVERKCLENEISYKWNQNDWIHISQKRPAVIAHPLTNEMAWFNQAHLFDFNPRFLGFWRYMGAQILYARPHMRLHQVFFGDKSPIPRDALYHVMDILDQNTIAFPWQKGDVLILDNILAMHGRAPFTGKRRILVAMTEA